MLFTLVIYSESLGAGPAIENRRMEPTPGRAELRPGWDNPKEQRQMAEYFIFLSTSIGLTLALMGLCLWLDYRRPSSW
jgi:hypothetical protein